MTYNVFSGTLNPAQSIKSNNTNQQWNCSCIFSFLMLILDRRYQKDTNSQTVYLKQG